jgi:hypothetical protein
VITTGSGSLHDECHKTLVVGMDFRPISDIMVCRPNNIGWTDRKMIFLGSTSQQLRNIQKQYLEGGSVVFVTMSQHVYTDSGRGESRTFLNAGMRAVGEKKREEHVMSRPKVLGT